MAGDERAECGRVRTAHRGDSLERRDEGLHLGADCHLGDDVPERLLQGFQVPTGQVFLHDTRDGQRRALRQISPALRVVLLVLLLGPERRRLRAIEE